MKVRVTKCSIYMGWYCDSIGEEFEFIRQFTEEDTYLVVDSYGYSNIILACDGELIQSEEEIEELDDE